MPHSVLTPLVCTLLFVPQNAPSSIPTPPKANDGSKAAARSLDDILGIPEEDRGGSRGADEIASEKREGAVDRALSGQPTLADLMQRALTEMKTSRARLQDAQDTGLGTQRAQEAALKALDALIASARQQQQQSSSSSSSSSQSKQSKGENGDPSEGKSEPSDSKPREQSEQSTKERSTTQDGSTSDSPAPFEQGNAGAELREARIEWGRLPRRVRELLLQGRRDHVSVPYERLTREYYQRLAEEASR